MANRALIAGAAALIILGGGAAQIYANNKVEEEIDTFLSDTGLKGKVEYSGASYGLLSGAITVNDVVQLSCGMSEPIDSVTVEDYEYSEEEGLSTISISINGLIANAATLHECSGGKYGAGSGLMGYEEMNLDMNLVYKIAGDDMSLTFGMEAEDIGQWSMDVQFGHFSSEQISLLKASTRVRHIIEGTLTAFDNDPLNDVSLSREDQVFAQRLMNLHSWMGIEVVNMSVTMDVSGDPEHFARMDAMEQNFIYEDIEDFVDFLKEDAKKSEGLSRKIAEGRVRLLEGDALTIGFTPNRPVAIDSLIRTFKNNAEALEAHIRVE